MVLPKKITEKSALNLIHTSSPVGKEDMKDFMKSMAKLAKIFKNITVFDVKRTELDPRYLAGSTKERLSKFRQAIKKVDWLAPIYGGTGCEDIVRKLTSQDLARIRKNRPVVNGFSDTTFLINFLYFKLKMISFHYSSIAGMSLLDNNKLFFDAIGGKINSFSFLEKDYEWLSDEAPENKIEGIAIGGNLSTFRDLLDISDIKIRSWKPYVLFIEEVDEDMENLHRIVSALDEKGIFKSIKALVIGKITGKMYENDFRITFKKLNLVFGKYEDKPEHVFEYLLSGVIKERIKQNNPLHILKANNLGHGVTRNAMLVPIGAKTTIYPDKKIEFIGPFVK
jgi:muramoyltetrapeptide carboxypeptidase LdcA involved in peptidoglycan recycling